MKLLNIFILLFAAQLFANTLYAQQQPEEKTPQEYALIEAERLTKELDLNSSQVFYVDSTLQFNFAAVKAEFDKMKKDGMQDPTSFMSVRDKWNKKTLDTFKSFFTEQQYIRYLKISGNEEGKKYKKGKDGLYYTKEELKKKKKK